MKTEKKLLLGMILVAGVLIPAGAFAQLPGQHINPNVTILLDTGRGMNWTQTANAFDGSDERTSESESQCNQMNEQTDFSVGTTSWQMVMEALLGSVPSEYTHCFFEEAGIRPMVRSDTISGLGSTIMSDPELLVESISDLTTEYWQFSREPHFRLINCRDPRSTSAGGRGDWNTEYQQCVGDLPDSTPGEVITTNTGRRYWCQSTVDGEQNYFVLDDGREICLNFHPLAQDRHTDGILEQHRTLARFSLMTFDNLPAPAKTYWDTGDNAERATSPWGVDERHRAGWDYGRDVRWYITAYEQRDPSDPDYADAVPATSASRYWNAGVRGPDPEAVGRLVPISDDYEASNQEVRTVLNSVEPNHCSFDAAMFDDAGEYYFTSPEVKPAYNEGADLFFNCRARVAFFITDGIQTDALEFPQDYCDKNDASGTSNAPPAPWEWDTHVAGTTYNCPFNSTSREVDEMFEVVNQLASDPDVEPLYLVVIGVNMKDKDTTADNRCDITGAWTGWDATAGECPAPANDCIVLKELGQSECVASAEDSEEVWVTPRQYLNKLALAGWPEEANVGGLYTAAPTGRFREPPWRTSPLEVDWCEGVANENNCGGEADDGEADGALFVNSTEELTQVMNMVLQALAPETAGTRTEIVTATNPDADVESTTAAAQFAMNSGYRTSTGGPWKGYLYRQGQTCTYDDGSLSGSGGDAADLVGLHEEIKSQTSRRIWVRKTDLTDDDLKYTSDTHFQEGLSGLLVKADESGVLFDNDLGIGETGSAASTLYVQAVLKYLYGTEAGSPRNDHPLGDIYNSTPAVLAPPNEQVPYASYHQFRSATKWVKGPSGDIATPTEAMNSRLPLLYVGTNDGILHSFNLMTGLRTDLDAEGWGFVPTMLLESIGRQFPINVKRTYSWNSGTGDWDSEYEVEDLGSDAGYQHIFGVDSPPMAADVLLYKTNDEHEEDYWRSLVIGGLGKGGYGYYALDVTAGPEHEPVYRWELSPDEYGTNAPRFAPADEDPTSEEALARQAFRQMGMGLSRPELAYVYIDAAPPKQTASGTQKHQVAVAILPGGFKSNEDGGIETATGVYIVRLADGKLIRYLDPTNPSDVIDNGMFESPLFFDESGSGGKTVAEKAMVAQLIGQPVVPNSIRSGKVADQAFIGDDRGRIWQIDMRSMDPAEWKLKVFFDTLLAEHYAYQDCLSDDAGNAAGDAGFAECCATKQTDVALACTASETAAIYNATGRDKDDFGIDKCTGKSCTNPAFPFPRIPMLAPPTIVQDEERNNVLLFGTGQIDGLETLDHHRIFSITQSSTIQMTTTDDGGTASDYTDDTVASAMVMSEPEINWWIGEDLPSQPLTVPSGTALGDIEDAMFPATTETPTHAAKDQADIDGFDFFGLGEKLLGRIFVFNKVAYFASFTPLTDSSENACNDGGSKIWGVNFNTVEEDDGGTTTRVFDKLVDPDDDSIVPFNVYPGEVFTGLRLVRKPSCGGREGFTLVVQKANPAAPATPSADPSTDAPQVIKETLDLPQPDMGFTRVGIDSWSIVMGGE